MLTLFEKTKNKQNEIDETYVSCRKDIDYLIKTFTVKNEDGKKKSTIPTVQPNLLHSIATLKMTLEEYKRYSQQKHDEVIHIK